MLRTHYFVITPEVRTDETVHALRRGWMRSIPHERLHFCVASGSDSAHLGQPTMLLLQDVQRAAGTPVTRDAFWQDREISASRRLALKESYNSFLRSKVLAMVREMAALASRSVSQSVSHYHTPSRELMDHTHSTVLLFRVQVAARLRLHARLRHSDEHVQPRRIRRGAAW